MAKKLVVVVKDPELAHRRQIERNVEANERRYGVAQMIDVRRRALKKQIRARVEAMVGPVKKAGEIHDAGDPKTGWTFECPDGLPNCRNCGDPQFAESCRAAGHCEHCGIDHGLAPDRVLAANGYELKEIEVDVP